MISFRQICGFLLTLSLGIMLAITIAFDFGTTGSWAASSFTPHISQPQNQIATINHAEAVTKNIEAKAQEAMGQ